MASSRRRDGLSSSAVEHVLPDAVEDELNARAGPAHPRADVWSAGHTAQPVLAADDLQWLRNGTALMFMHIPVCAGRSINRMLEKQLRNYGVSYARSKEWKRQMRQGQTLKVTGGKRRGADIMKAPFLTCEDHLSTQELVKINRQRQSQGHSPYQQIIFIRDPVKRATSWVYNQLRASERAKFLATHAGGTRKNAKTEEARNNLQNRMVWQLGDDFEENSRTMSLSEAFENAKEVLRNAWFVGRVEDLPASYNALAHSLGIPLCFF